MPWKYDTEGNLETRDVDGKPVPVRILADGTDEVYGDPDAVQRKLAAANRESADRKEQIAKLNGRLEALGPVVDLLGEDGDPGELVKEHRKLQREIKAAGKSALDDETQAKLARLHEIEEELAQTAAREKAADARTKELEGAVEKSRSAIHALTAGREVQQSRWFRGQNGDDPLSRLHPEQAEDYFAKFGEPHPEDPTRVNWYRTTEHKADDLIRDPETGKAAGADYAIGVIGPEVYPRWWDGYLSDKGATGTGAGGKGGPGSSAPHLSKADMRDTQKKAEFAKQYGATAFQAELDRHAEAGAN